VSLTTVAPKITAMSIADVSMLIVTIFYSNHRHC
jgi:hypothetical protein